MIPRWLVRLTEGYESRHPPRPGVQLLLAAAVAWMGIAWLFLAIVEHVALPWLIGGAVAELWLIYANLWRYGRERRRRTGVRSRRAATRL
jgi:hypothetical protein